MGWIFSDRTPFLLGLLFALLTWQAGELFKEVRSGKAIVYELIDDPPDKVRLFGDSTLALRIENPSRTDNIGPFSFTVICPDGKACLGEQFDSVVQAPMLPTKAKAFRQANMTMIEADLPPGAVVWLVVEQLPLAEGEEERDFRTLFKVLSASDVGPSAEFNDPEVQDAVSSAATEDAVRVIHGASTEGLIVTRWLDFLYYGLIVVLGAIALWLLGAFVAGIKQARRAGPDHEKARRESAESMKGTQDG